MNQTPEICRMLLIIRFDSYDPLPGHVIITIIKLLWVAALIHRVKMSAVLALISASSASAACSPCFEPRDYKKREKTQQHTWRYENVINFSAPCSSPSSTGMICMHAEERMLISLVAWSWSSLWALRASHLAVFNSYWHIKGSERLVQGWVEFWE